MIDVIIPTCRSIEEVLPLVYEIQRTAGCEVNVIPTCQDASASINRNYGLDRATSDPLIMVDDDITGLPAGWVLRMVQVMEEYPNCQMASPQLMRPDGGFGIMTGGPRKGGTDCEVLRARELCTACIIIRNTGLRFDENFIGSGFEDNDYCRQLIERYPVAEFICIHNLRVIHRNEMKNQHGRFWDANQAYFRTKWQAK